MVVSTSFSFAVSSRGQRGITYRNIGKNTFTIIYYGISTESPISLGRVQGPTDTSCLKSVYQQVWEREEVLMNTTRWRFKRKDNINQWLFRYWQVASGKFVPRSPEIGKYFDLGRNVDKICKANRWHQKIHENTGGISCQRSQCRCFDFIRWRNRFSWNPECSGPSGTKKVEYLSVTAGRVEKYDFTVAYSHDERWNGHFSEGVPGLLKRSWGEKKICLDSWGDGNNRSHCVNGYGHLSRVWLCTFGKHDM